MKAPSETKAKPSVRSFTVPIYRCRVYYSDSTEESAKLWPEARGYLGVCGSTAKGLYIAIHDRTLNTLVHECVHLCNHVLARAGVPISQEADEAAAYLTEWLFKRLRKELKL
ncbi:hypothetical protein [Achromobacter phage Motura]|uniref:Uncharacterized protein n=1 Tax=Achromobacter phage Motura TaxID=2591403 RepID=A0A514CT40_9CAUD|nr:hypothetical protein H1O15_gp099 [Achromobacter phage Motura]QDH83651.1 hypothetical protein [Achromobacter phage Motura]